MNYENRPQTRDKFSHFLISLEFYPRIHLNKVIDVGVCHQTRHNLAFFPGTTVYKQFFEIVIGGHCIDEQVTELSVSEDKLLYYLAEFNHFLKTAFTNLDQQVVAEQELMPKLSFQVSHDELLGMLDDFAYEF